MYYNVGSNDLAFGFGRHACPGRYLGHMNIKLVLSEILLNYDIALLEGAKLPESEYFEALVSSHFNSCLPPCTKSVLIYRTTG